MDDERRALREGRDSTYNHLYSWLLSNYEPRMLKDSAVRERATRELLVEGARYEFSMGGSADSGKILSDAEDAVDSFIRNGRGRGDTARNLGKAQSSSLEAIKSALEGLRF